MFRRNARLQFTIPNFKGRIVCGYTGRDTAVINRNKGTINAATTVPGIRSPRISARMRGFLLKDTRFGHDSGIGGLNVETSSEFEINKRKDKLSPIIQHFVVSLQKQIDWYGRLEQPQRHFQGEVCLVHDSFEQEWAIHPSVTWKQKVKTIDTGYLKHQADLINVNRDELFHRCVKHFKKKRINLKLVCFTDAPPGFRVAVKWRSDDDKFAMTPEGESIMIPRTDTFQQVAKARHIGLGNNKSALSY
eukprot:TRINITY_DN33755_c0_g1_i1.p1 TRINITY_DN33755_c0_g1~~TRINITY_DN33755_c0_g1_i1.p1  ORF type:complete len:247 (+),score=8.98 TRINITY_DN33755_c0_g1_i1:46-786(+)